MARGLKFWIYELEGLYYLCSENKGADQTDLRLCFRICKNPVFSLRGSYSHASLSYNCTSTSALRLLTIACLCIQLKINWASFWENRSSGVSTRSHANWDVQPLKMARDLKFLIYKIEILFYLCSENTGADQLFSYCAADLRLCFCICKNSVFPEQGSIIQQYFPRYTADFIQMSRNMRKPTMWILTRSDTNQAVQLLEMARGLKLWI